MFSSITPPQFIPPKRRVYSRRSHATRVSRLLYAARTEHGFAELVPYVRLSGRWLDRLGFEVGAVLHIEARKDRIVLTVAERPVHVEVKLPRKLQRAAGGAP